MDQLILKRAPQVPGRTKEDYDVWSGGEVVGRIFKDDGMTGPPGFGGSPMATTETGTPCIGTRSIGSRHEGIREGLAPGVERTPSAGATPI